MKHIYALCFLLTAWQLACVGQSSMTITAGTTVRIAAGTTIVLKESDLVNNGTIVSAAGSKISFSGAQDVHVSGTGTTSLNGLELGLINGKKITLLQDIVVNGSLLFNGGFLDLGNATVNLGTTGTLVSESESSRATTTGLGNFLSQATLAAPSAANPGNLGAVITSAENLGVTEVRRFHAPQSSSAGTSIGRYYVIAPANNNNLGATIRLAYFDAELNGLTEGTLSLWRSNNNGGSWVDLGTSDRNTVTNYVEESGLQSLSRFALADGNTGLSGLSIGADAGTVCSGSGTNLNVTGGPSNGSITISFNGGPDQTLALDAAGEASISTGALSTSAVYTITSINNGSTTTPASVTTTVQVNSVSMNAVTSQVVCNGAQTAAINFSGPVGNTYTWTNSNSSIGLAGSGSGHIASFTAINNSNAQVSGTIAVTAFHILNGVTCSAPAQNFTITVNPGFAASINYSGSPYCNSTGTVTPQITGTAGGTFSSTTGLALDAGTGAIDPGASAAGTYTIQYSAGSGCGSSATTQVIIRPSPLVASQPNQVICAGSATIPANFGLVPGINYSWSNNNTSIGLAAAGSGSIPDFITQNATTQLQVATVTVSTSGGTGCEDKPMVFRYSIKPKPTVNPVPGQTVCAGTMMDSIIFTGNLPGTTYSWSNSNASIGIRNNGTGNIAAINAINNSGVLQVANLFVIPANSGCTGTGTEFSISVSPSAGTIAYSQPSYCQAGWAYITRTGSAGGVFSAVPAGLIPDVVTGAVNLAASTPGIYTVTYTLDEAAGCIATTSTTLRLNAQATVNPQPNPVYCNGVTTAPISFTGTGSSYIWTNDNPSVGLGVSGTGNIPSFITVNDGPATQYATIRVSPQGNGSTSCTSKPLSFRITVKYCPPITHAGDTGGDSQNMRMAIAVSPNPTNGKITVINLSSDPGASTVQLLTNFGQAVSKPLFISGRTATLDLSGLAPGIYRVCWVNNRTGSVSQQQVVKF
jgi:hypothetical protein